MTVAFRRGGWMRDAVDDGGFKTPPECAELRARLHEGAYHVDLPVYRRVTTKDVFGNETHYYDSPAPTGTVGYARGDGLESEKENDTQSPTPTTDRSIRRSHREMQ